MKSVLAICLSPTFQRIMVFKEFHEDQVNRSGEILELASGKGINVSRVLNNLGRPCTNLIQLGGERVNQFLALCEKDGLSVCYLPVKADIRTCTTIINSEKHTSTELVEESRTVESSDSERLFDLFLQELPKHDAVVITGTKAAGFAADLYPRMVRECRKNNIMTVLDIKGQELKECLKEHPSIIKPNLSELCATYLPNVRVFENSDDSFVMDDVAAILKEIYETYGACSVITRGKNDTWIYDGQSFQTVCHKIKLPVVNTIGCGDTLTAAMTHKLLEGQSLAESVQYGMECATIKASRLGQGI